MNSEVYEKLKQYMKNNKFEYTFKNDANFTNKEEIQNLMRVTKKLSVLTSAVDEYEARERFVEYKRECKLISDEWNKKLNSLNEKYFVSKTYATNKRSIFKRNKNIIDESFDSRMDKIQNQLLKRYSKKIKQETKQISTEEILKDTVNIRNQYETTFYDDFNLKTPLISVTLQSEKPFTELVLIENNTKISFSQRIKFFFKNLPDNTKRLFELLFKQLGNQLKRLKKLSNELYKAIKNENVIKIKDSLNALFNSFKEECKENAQILSNSIVNYLDFFLSEINNLEKIFREQGLSYLNQEHNKYETLYNLLNDNYITL